MIRLPFHFRNMFRPVGFTLVEVMFAVITLGIGLIMIAAIFPVAIAQRKTTSEESTAAALAPQAMQIMNEIASYVGPVVNLPGTSNTSQVVAGITVPFPGTVQSLRNPQIATATTANFKSEAFTNIGGGLILSADPRLAWIAMYRRDGLIPTGAGGIPTTAEAATWTSTAQIILIAVQARNTSTFTSNDYLNATGSGVVNLQAKPIRVAISNNDPAADQIIISPNTQTADYTSAAVQGAYIIIADDGLRSNTDNGRMNGRIYKLGTQLSPNVFELAPGNDFDTEPDPDGPVTGTKSAITSLPFGSPPNLAYVDAFIVGRGLTDTSGTGGADNFSGPAMDVAAYTAFVPTH